nr:MAG TPA_asm: hypothetical protein [Caudoviricetes sp.]
MQLIDTRQWPYRLWLVTECQLILFSKSYTQKIDRLLISSLILVVIQVVRDRLIE